MDPTHAVTQDQTLAQAQVESETPTFTKERTTCTRKKKFQMAIPIWQTWSNWLGDISDSVRTKK